MIKKTEIDINDQVLSNLFDWYLSIEVDYFLEFLDSKHDVVKDVSLFRKDINDNLADSIRSVKTTWLKFDENKYSNAYEQFLDFAANATKILFNVMVFCSPLLIAHINQTIHYKDIRYIRAFFKASSLTKKEYQRNKKHILQMLEWNDKLANKSSKTPDSYSSKRSSYHSIVLKERLKEMRAVPAWMMFNNEMVTWADWQSDDSTKEEQSTQILKN